MAKLQASWIHGSSVQPQREGYFIVKRRYGSGTVYKTHGQEWFHFAIPTPVIMNDQRSSLTKVFVLFDGVLDAKIIKIHVCDANEPINMIENLSLTGNHSEQIDQVNSWNIDPPHQMKYGLGVSVCVDFGATTQQGVPNIKFTSAGADFYTP